MSTMVDVQIYREHIKIKTPRLLQVRTLRARSGNFLTPFGHRDYEPEEEYTLYLSAESTPIDAMHIPAAPPRPTERSPVYAPPPVRAAPPRTRSWRSSSHAADTAAARASAYDAAGNLKIAARKARTSAVSRTRPSSPRGDSLLIHFAVHMNPRPSASPSLPSYLPPALFSARDVIITDNPTPSPTPRSAAAAPATDSARALSSTRSTPCPLSPGRPTSLEAKSMAVASPLPLHFSCFFSIGSARTSRPALYAVHTIDRAHPAHPVAIAAHRAIAPLLPPRLASPALRHALVTPQLWPSFPVST
ncbi:hypothetical protein FB451DRAFT_1556926 [Mycena latifolia]|nr:hypothetical protein FB451DRAFT_1556926 [Mycena latifolia]